MTLRGHGHPASWDDLRRELDRWSEADRVCTLWWRDDDAGEPIPSLIRLLELAGAFGVQVALATVPQWATSGLVKKLEGGSAIVLQHGFQHCNHAAPGERAVECGGERPVDEVLEELRNGRGRLELLFGSRFLSILVPPWNRIAESVLSRLPELAYLGLSTYGSCLSREPRSGLMLMDTHVDVLTWRGRVGFAGEDKLLRALIGNLQGRRSGAVDHREPVGLLTHHKNHDEAAWQFMEALLRVTTRHPAARWLGIQEVLARKLRATASPESAAS